MTAFRKTVAASTAAVALWCVCGPALWSADRSRPARDPRPVAAAIDRHIDRRLAAEKVPASPQADDAEFLRRLSLDLRGRIPSAERAAAFLADADPDKRAKLIDEFLADAAFGEHFGTVWYHRLARPTMDNRGLLSYGFRDWLAERFNRNDGWDAIVREVLTASGDRDANPATVFWLAHAEGNQRREIVPARVTATVSNVFLGVKLECCECHNHPFDDGYKQTDFWGMAAFFTATRAENSGRRDEETPGVTEKVPANRPLAAKAVAAKFKGKAKAKAVPNANPKVAAKIAAMQNAASGTIEIPDSKGKTVKAQFLHATAPSIAGKSEYRPVLANWVTSPTNPYFAKAMVNRVWAGLFGRGIVNPIDDMRSDASNSHPDLLTELAKEFTASGFDVKHLVRCICNSRAYQRTSQPLSQNKADEELYSHAALKTMSVDVLYDSLSAALSREPVETGRAAIVAKVKAKAKGATKGAKPGREEFRAFFHAEAEDDAAVSEEYTHGIPQVLRLMNARSVNDTRAVIAQVMKADSSPDKVVAALYLRTLTRYPTNAESARMAKYVADASTPARGYAEILWALINSSEFLFNH